MYELFTFHNLCTVIGASLGGLKSVVNLFKKPDTRKRFTSKYAIWLFTIEVAVDFIISIALSISFAAIYFNPEDKSPLVYLISGIFTGYVGSYALELFEVMFPDIFRQLFRLALFHIDGNKSPKLTLGYKDINNNKNEETVDHDNHNTH
ncbi:Uncharacterised protein [Oligella urethralis]|uniref:hypothetical protein n=1 Tax=Oligella urethralis TaxID=90245 RepID=UPI000E00BFC6|nr:hypothetical protein [Oligella urethralis]SUA63198.1 Uncharacterised protein [Oligella urethralis]